MELKNGYRVIYKAADLVTEEKPGPIYASKILQRKDGQMLTSLKCEDSSYVDVSTFKLIYSDGVNLIGSTSIIPSEEDVKFYLIDEEGAVVYGEGPEVPPTPKYTVAVSPVEHCVVSGAGQYEEGAEVEITVKPAEGYMFGDGNEPKAKYGSSTDIMTLDEERGLYHSTLIIGTEDIDVTIEGVVVEAIPEPLKPAIRMYCIATAEAGLDEGDVKVVEEPIPTDYIEMPNSELTDGYYRFAIDKRLGEVAHIYMNNVETDIKDDMFTRSEGEFGGQEFAVFTCNDETSIALDTFKFVF